MRVARWRLNRPDLPRYQRLSLNPTTTTRGVRPVVESAETRVFVAAIAVFSWSIISVSDDELIFCANWTTRSIANGCDRGARHSGNKSG